MGPYDKMGNPFELIFDQLNRIESILIHLKSQNNTPEVDAPKRENFDDNSILLAVRITGLKKKTIYNLVNRRVIPHAKKGKRLYFDERELKDWIKSGKRKTIGELSSESF